MLMLAIAATLAGSPPLRVVALGTSLTAHAGWSGPLAAKLERCRGAPVTVTEVAAPGRNSRWGLQQLDRVMAAKPEVVLVEFASNDAALHRGLWLADSRRTMARIVGRLRATRPGLRVIVMGMNPISGPRGWLRPRLDTFTDAHLADAVNAGVEAVDFRPVWGRMGAATRAAAIPDGAHPLPAEAARVIVPGLAARLGCGPGV